MSNLVMRLRTKDGTERLTTTSSATLGALRAQIEASFGVPVVQQRLARAEGLHKKGPVLATSEDGKTLAALGMTNGEMLYLDYEADRENQAHYVEKDPFKTMVQQGELRQQGTSQWTLTNFLDYRSSKEFVLGAPPEPHSKFVQIDQAATQTLMNYMILTGFRCKRVGWLYGRWVTDAASGEAGVQVHAIYEPAQDCTDAKIVVTETDEDEAKVSKVAELLGLRRVGVIIAHPAREYVFSVNELLYSAKLHAKAVELDPEEGKRFVTMKARPVLETEDDIEGVATVEAYQVTDQCVELAVREAFYESKTDPRVAKTAADCTFVVEKKEQRKASVEHFVARVFDIVRPLDGSPFSSFLGSGFAVEHRPTESQEAAFGTYLRNRRSRGEPFIKSVADLHFLLFLANFLDLNSEMPVLCQAILEGKAGELDGFQLMINSYAGLD